MCVCVCMFPKVKHIPNLSNCPVFMWESFTKDLENYYSAATIGRGRA